MCLGGDRRDIEKLARVVLHEGEPNYGDLPNRVISEVDKGVLVLSERTVSPYSSRVEMMSSVRRVSSPGLGVRATIESSICSEERILSCIRGWLCIAY